MTQPAPDWTASRTPSRPPRERRQSHAIRSPSGPAASKQRPLSYRNRWSSVPAQQSPSLERAYRPRSRNAHFFRCSVRDARGSAAAQNWATLPTLCKPSECLPVHRVPNLVAWDSVWAAVGARYLKLRLCGINPRLCNSEECSVLPAARSI